jgi:hypothetical protein
MSGMFHRLEWARIGADTLFLVFGVFPIVLAVIRGVFLRGGEENIYQISSAREP